MNPEYIAGLLKVLGPVLKDSVAAQAILQRFWRDKIALVWTAQDIHRAANELGLALTPAQARSILADLLKHHNPEYGLQRRDLRDYISNSRLGRALTACERQRFRQKDVLAVECRQSPRPKHPIPACNRRAGKPIQLQATP